MTEEESREALFRLNNEYMKHSSKERLELYEEYKSKRAEIRRQLTLSKDELKEKSLGK